MNVHFQKLDNGDWVCYDYMNTTGDLFVDPEKIDLLKALLPPAQNLGTWYAYDMQQEVYVNGFGRIKVKARLRIETNGVIKSFSLMTPNEEMIGSFTTFVLDLEALPAFEEYVYPDVNGEADAQESGE